MERLHFRRRLALLSAIALLANAPAALALLPEGDYIEVAPAPDKGASTYHGMRDKPVTVEDNEVTISRDMSYTPTEYTPDVAVDASGDVIVNTQSVEISDKNSREITAISAKDGATVNVDGVVTDRMDTTWSGKPVAVVVGDDSSVTIEGREGEADALSMLGGECPIGIDLYIGRDDSTANLTVKKGNVVVKGGDYGAGGIDCGEIVGSGHTFTVDIQDGDLIVEALSGEAYGIVVGGTDELVVTAGAINVSCGDHPQTEEDEALGLYALLAGVTVNADINASVAENTFGGNDVKALGMYTGGVELTVNGSVSTIGNAASGIIADLGGSSILITGDAETNGEHAILVQPIEDLGGSTVAILGELKGGDIAVSSTDGMQFILGSATLNEDGTSPIVMVDEEGTPVELTEEQQAQLNELVYYIVGSEDAQITIDGTEAYVARNGETYQIASLGSTITVTPVQTGKTIESVKLYSDAAQTVQIETIMNADGSCTLLWPSDRVDLRTISAVLTYLKETDPDRKVTVKTVPAKDSVGDTVRFGGADWIITDIDEETGLYTLASVASFTEEQLQDLQRLLDELLTDAELTYVQKDEAQLPIVSLITEEVAEQYFGGRTDHLCIVTDPAFPRG